MYYLNQKVTTTINTLDASMLGDKLITNHHVDNVFSSAHSSSAICNYLYATQQFIKSFRGHIWKTYLSMSSFRSSWIRLLYIPRSFLQLTHGLTQSFLFFLDHFSPCSKQLLQLLLQHILLESSFWKEKKKRNVKLNITFKW